LCNWHLCRLLKLPPTFSLAKLQKITEKTSYNYIKNTCFAKKVENFRQTFPYLKSAQNLAKILHRVEVKWLVGKTMRENRV
jgi:hypothetical protein